MRINRLELKDFLAYEEAQLDLALGKVFIFSGPTGSGKSSLLDAVRWLLKAKVRGLEIGADAVRRSGGSGRISVEGDFLGVGGEVFTHKRTLTTEVFTNAQLEERLGASLPVLHALLDASRFLYLNEEERLRLLQDIAGAEANDELLREHGLDDPELITRVRRLGLKSAHALATQHRRACDSRLRDTKPVPPEDRIPERGTRPLSQIAPEAIEEHLVTYRAKRDALRDEISTLKGSGSRREEAEKVVGDTKRQAEEAEAALAKAKASLEALVDPAEDRAAIANLKAERLKYEPILVGLMADVKSLKDQHDAVLAEYHEAEGMPDGAQCPKCRRDISTKALLDTLKAESKILKGRFDDAKAAYQQAKGIAADIHQKATVCSARIESYDADHERLQREVAKWESQVAVLTAMFGKAQARLSEVPEDKVDVSRQEEALKGLDADISILEKAKNEVLDYRKALAIYEERKKIVDEETRNRDRYRTYEEILAPTGVVATALAVPLVELREKVAAMSSAVFGTDPLDVRDDMSVTLRGMSVDLLSSGERLLVGSIITAALCSMAKVGIMFLDDVSLIDAEARDAFLKMLLVLTKKGGIDQVFLCLTRDRSGYCIACQKPRVALKGGACTDCGALVGPTPIRGPLVGTVRQFAVSAGTVAEIKGEQ